MSFGDNEPDKLNKAFSCVSAVCVVLSAVIVGILVVNDNSPSLDIEFSQSESQSEESFYEAYDVENGCSAYASVRGNIYDVRIVEDVDDVNCDVLIEYKIYPFGYSEGHGHSSGSCGSAWGVSEGGSSVFSGSGRVQSFATGCGSK